MQHQDSLDFAQRLANVKSMQVIIRALSAYQKLHQATNAKLQLECSLEGVIAAFGTDIKDGGHEKFLNLLEKSEQLGQLEHAFMLAQSYGASKEQLDNIESQALEIGSALYPKTKK